eukprot:5068874-Prorocentrum_lima.AAC.1
MQKWKLATLSPLGSSTNRIHTQDTFIPIRITTCWSCQKSTPDTWTTQIQMAIAFQRCTKDTEAYWVHWPGCS